MADKYTVLVSGATGNQGGAVAQALINNGHSVRALTRNLNSPAAKQLQNLGADLILGDFNDAESISKALQQVDAFYLMGSPFEVGVEGETKQGIVLANAAKEVGIGHLIYGSVANADLKTGIPHFESKYKVEQHIMTLGVPYTISAPVFFMDNVVAPWSIDSLKAGKIMQAMPKDRLLQQISVKNIGEFVASLIDRRPEVFGKRFDIAGDELTGEEMANIITRTTENQTGYESFPVSLLKEQSEDMAAMFEWFNTVGYNVNIPALKKEFSDVDWQDYSQWGASKDWTSI